MNKFTPLNTALEIAKRISFQPQKSRTSFIVRLSIIATTISVAAIIICFSIVNGFQASISNKVYSFWGNIQIGSNNGTLLETDTVLQQKILQLNGVQAITPFAIQTGVISFQNEMEGIIIKGIPKNQIPPFLEQGKALNNNKGSLDKEIILSTQLAKALQLTLGDSIRLYIMSQDHVQQRKLKLVGLFHSGMEDYDKNYAIVDLHLLQNLVQNNQAISGYSVSIDNEMNVQKIQSEIQRKLSHNQIASTIESLYPQIFDWIEVQTINRNLSITILLIIAIVNLLTCLYIFMLEKINLIGLLTALGGEFHLIQKVFLYQASFISWMGIFWGLIIGIGLSLLQQYTGWIKLDEAAYFMKVLPIQIKPIQILLIVLGTAFISYLSFILPSFWIKKITPSQAIKLD